MTATYFPGRPSDPNDLYVGQMVPHDRYAAFGANSFAALTSQAMRLHYFTSIRSETVTQVSSFSGGTAAGATPSLCRIGIYQIDDNGDGTLVASIANDTTLWAATNFLYVSNFSASLDLVIGRRYAGAFLCVTAAAAPVMISPNVGVTGLPDGQLGLAPRISGSLNGQANLPASFLGSALVPTKVTPTFRLH